MLLVVALFALARGLPLISRPMAILVLLLVFWVGYHVGPGFTVTKVAYTFHL